MGIGDKIKAILDSKDISHKEFAARVEMDRSKLSKILNGSQSVKVEELMTFAKALNMSTDDLLGIANVSVVKTNDLVKIPIVGTIKAGSDGLAFEELEGYSAFLQSDIKRGSDYVVLKVKGDSMIGDNINEGDHALIELEAEYEKNKVYAVIINGYEATLKHVIKEDDRIILSASNPAYPPKVIMGEELQDIRIIGRMVKLQRSF